MKSHSKVMHCVIFQSSEQRCTLAFRRDLWEISRALDLLIVDLNNKTENTLNSALSSE